MPSRAALPDAASPGGIGDPRQITPAMLRQWPLPEPKGSKYARGQVLVVGGARGTPGAAMLAGTAALRMGAGRLTMAVAESVAAHVAVALPECGVESLAENRLGSVTGVGAHDTLEPELDRADGLLVGPGLDDPPGAARLVKELARGLRRSVNVVLDSMGATVLPDLDSATTKALEGRLILTPNENELARLLGQESVQPAEICTGVLEVARRFDAVVTAGSFVADRDGLWELSTGDTGLGTSGSGDVLSGAVAGLICRGASPVQATVWAKYVHAAAGDDLAARFGRVGYLAGDLLPVLPVVLSSLRGD